MWDKIVSQLFKGIEKNMLHQMYYHTNYNFIVIYKQNRNPTYYHCVFIQTICNCTK